MSLRQVQYFYDQYKKINKTKNLCKNCATYDGSLKIMHLWPKLCFANDVTCL